MHKQAKQSHNPDNDCLLGNSLPHGTVSVPFSAGISEALTAASPQYFLLHDKRFAGTVRSPDDTGQPARVVYIRVLHPASAVPKK